MTDEALKSAGIPVLEKNEELTLPTVLDPAPEEKEPEKDKQKDAMHSGQSRQFQGMPLHPFDWRRQEAAESLGLKIFKLEIDEEDDFKGQYDGMAGDAVIIVWLCTLTPSQVAKAIRLPAQATEHRLKWADKKIAGMGTDAHIEMMEVFGEIIGSYMDSLSESTSTPGKPQEA